MKSESCSVVSDSLQPHGLDSPWNFFRPEYWSGQPFPSPGDLPDSGIELGSPAFSGRFFTNRATRETQEYWSGQPFPPPAGLPDPGIQLGSPALQADSLPAEL